MASKPDPAALAAALIAKHTALKGPKCSVAALLTHEDPVVRHLVEHAGSVKHETLSAALNECGVRLGSTTISRHVRKLCQCPR